ncbi:hypothetical protein QTP70_005285 [Hemibagrus guttatus]|uniref:Reverse transcriptase domain-containing protein n=1 Tax=Hemibagrus guttatus TaxID=175788 RepID=A0AAE0PZZ1_9TELE|nr:hypothetical protein QTP70_005285 [Hemibagrus guttatus]
MCGMNLALVRDALAWAEQRRVPLALLSLNQEKAFDCVSHEFLFALLEWMGFGPDFSAMVQLRYTGVVSRVIINGYLFKLIVQRGGFRQGCPISPLLYVLFLEPLVEQLRSGHDFQGLHIPGMGRVRAKVSAYADNTMLFLGREEDFSVVERVIKAFSDATGARVNCCKSFVLYAGAWAGRTDVPEGFSLCRDLGGCFMEGQQRPKELGHRPQQVASEGQELGQERSLPDWESACGEC